MFYEVQIPSVWRPIKIVSFYSRKKFLIVSAVCMSALFCWRTNPENAIFHHNSPEFLDNLCCLRISPAFFVHENRLRPKTSDLGSVGIFLTFFLQIAGRKLETIHHFFDHFLPIVANIFASWFLAEILTKASCSFNVLLNVHPLARDICVFFDKFCGLPVGVFGK